MSKNSISFRSSRIVYHGPYPCKNCGVSIVQMGHEFGGNAFTAPDGNIYPNTEWHVHVCDPADVYVRKGKEACTIVRDTFKQSAAVRLSLGWIVVSMKRIILSQNKEITEPAYVISAHQTYSDSEWGAWQSALERQRNDWPAWLYPDKYPILEEKE